MDFPNGNGRTLSQYALEEFGDTHILDVGRKGSLRGKLDSFLSSKYGNTNLDNHGIIDNLSSVSVWSKGVITKDYCGVSLLTLSDYDIFDDLDVVWVFENENTATRLHMENCDIPFIIGSGQPNRAVIELLSRLGDVQILYHGDMDPTGLSIASRLKKTFPNIKTPLMTPYHFNERSKYAYNGSTNVSAPFFATILSCIKRTKTAVYEEQFDCSDFKRIYERERRLLRK